MSATDDDATAEYGQRPFEAPPGATEILLVRHGQSAPVSYTHLTLPTN